jgi:hypothetical protein
LKDPPRIFQKQLAGYAQFHAARQPVEQFEAYLFLQILDLSGQRRLGHS